MGWGHLPDGKVAVMKIQDALLQGDKVSEEALWKETMKRGRPKFKSMDETIEFIFWKNIRHQQCA